jgi:predicted SAM-dependent methyltransferase
VNLVIGAGDRRVEGFKHHDVLPLDGLDFICEFFDLPAYVENGTCEKIQMTHVLEHFPMDTTQDVLVLIYNMLQKGGELYIEVPNFHWHGQMILQNPRDRQIVQYAYGGQKDMYDFHYNGFTPEILREDLLEAGFTVEKLNPNSSIECWATK